MCVEYSTMILVTETTNRKQIFIIINIFLYVQYQCTTKIAKIQHKMYNHESDYKICAQLHVTKIGNEMSNVTKLKYILNYNYVCINIDVGVTLI